ncbi:hypothetical protein J5N97_006518 [Dioscorea zingiberensis]|uniref:Scarecrow-like protein 18 n=1 Tax=Dioscorea zingiberensis TaxID=325984 RepID=A0A9D5DD78_9LILI|nr:hypothetical protein J5N97_006518 [Dioscorea zingiberensis]
MLTSLDSHEEEEEAQEEDHRHHHHHHHHHFLLPSPSQSRDLLIASAELVHRREFPAALHALSLLSSSLSPLGDSSDRLAHQFTLALSSAASSSSSAVGSGGGAATSYLSFNQVTPFLRFAHLTANQAILDAVGAHGRIHIVDFDILHGVQWPPFLQAIAERSDHRNPPFIRLTGIGTDTDILRRTGDRLRSFATSLGLSFHFHPLLLPPSSAPLPPPSLQLHPGEILAVNCSFFLHKLLGSESQSHVTLFLQSLKRMNPVILTMAEVEASHNSPVFMQRFMEAMDYYSAVFESLEATLPPKSQERVAVEQEWLGREISGIVAGVQRHERFDWWESVLKDAGFINVPLGGFALSQARLLLRLHYPSEGYQLHSVKDSFFLGWQNKPLFSVSSWH